MFVIARVMHARFEYRGSFSIQSKPDVKGRVLIVDQKAKNS
jgi:hypothetical protein